MINGNYESIIESLKNTLLKEIEKTNTLVIELQNKNKKLEIDNKKHEENIFNLLSNVQKLEENVKKQNKELDNLSMKEENRYFEYLNNKTITDNSILRIESLNNNQNARLDYLESINFNIDGRVKIIEHEIEILG